MNISICEAANIGGRQALVRRVTAKAERCIWLIATIAAICNPLSARTAPSDFPEQPDSVDRPKWVALQTAVAQTLPVEIKLTAIDGAAGDKFGYQVALSGNTALVGATTKTVGANINQGAAYVFVYNGSAWIEQQELTASDGAAGDYFSESVAVSGTSALIGASGRNSGEGAAYVFTYDGSTWVERQELTPDDGATGDSFGFSVALSGSTALIGAQDKTIGANSFQGAAYVFAFDGSTWVQQQELTANDGAALDDFGSVALSGNIALVGAVGFNSSQGAAYVFASDGNTWTQQQELTASDGTPHDAFGRRVALSGATALVGAYGKTIGSNVGEGAAYLFTASDGTWSEQQRLTASDGATGDRFGATVALSGPSALVGAFTKAVGSNANQGAAYLYAFNDSSWAQQQELTASDGAVNDEFGIAVALSGTTALVGSPYNTIGANSQGAAYIYQAADLIFCDDFDDAGACD